MIDRHAGHDDDIADSETRRLGDRILDEFGAGGSRAMRRRAALRSSRLDPLQQQLDGARVFRDRHAEGRADRIRRHIVMRRADAAGGEDIGIAVPQSVKRGDDLIDHIGHDAHFAQIDAALGQKIGGEANILVLGPARSEFRRR